MMHWRNLCRLWASLEPAMKLLFFVGKGGVGKSTSSSLFSVHLAAAGKQVLLNSIDPAHNLSDIFLTPIGHKPKRLMPNLWVMETDLSRWVKKSLKDTEREFKSAYKYQDAFNLSKYFTTLKYSPGLEEHALLLAIQDAMERHKDKEFVIFDTPPTALTMRFLALPETTLVWMRELKKIRKTIIDKKEIILRIRKDTSGKETERDVVLEKIEYLIATYEKLSAVLQDQGSTKVFLILNPDNLSKSESISIGKELGNLGIGIPFVVVNKYVNESDFKRQLMEDFPESRIGVINRLPSELTGIPNLTSEHLPIEISAI